MKNPVVFAKGIISTKQHEHSAPAMSPDKKEIYWSSFDTSSVPVQKIYFIKFENNKWSNPRIASFSGIYSDGGPCFTNNGNRLFFYSHRPIIGNTAEIKDDIWYVDRIGSEWTTPKNLGLSYLSNREKWIFSPSISDSGNIYITGAINNVNGLYKIHIDKGMTRPKKSLQINT